MPVIIRQRECPDNHALPDTLHPVIRRVLAARQVLNDDELDYTLKSLQPYQTLEDITPAVDLLQEALEHQRHILIVADFDADGATSCAVGIRALQMMGATKLSYIVPDRAKHGYGLTPPIVDIAAEHQPELLITVDNGISSFDGVQAAKDRDIKVLVTDHHLPSDQLPNADAIVNPNRLDDNFPSKNLAGVGVIFYVMMALRARLREINWFESRGLPEPNLAQLLDLVALGTVADVVTLDYNNRILVEQGLRRMRGDQCCPGIRALMRVTRREQPHLVATDLAFYLGPRLNAAGRMENMSYGIECLLTDNDADAKTHAEQLDVFNQERRAVEADMLDDALSSLSKLSLDAEDTNIPFGLCLFDDNWHQGVIGILASRIKDRLNRPVIIFTSNEENTNEIKGSARSVRGVHIRDVLDAIAAKNTGLVTKFGGHAMAAGMSLSRENLEQFQQAFDEEVRRHLSQDDLQGMIYTDGELTAQDLTIELAELLRNLTPWGQNFPEPMFSGRFKLVQKRNLKDQHLKLWIQPPDSNQTVEVIAFNTTDKDWPERANTLELVYRLEVNIYRGAKSVQLNAAHIQAFADKTAART
ncbi:MAG: single-stranded-DNA-specific exonuclease RecJ [Pseudomonadota bacterium]